MDSDHAAMPAAHAPTLLDDESDTFTATHRRRLTVRVLIGADKTGVARTFRRRSRVSLLRVERREHLVGIAC